MAVTVMAQLQGRKKVLAIDMNLSIGQNLEYMNNVETGKGGCEYFFTTPFFCICECLGITPHEFLDTGSRQPAQLRPFVDKFRKLSHIQFTSIEIVIDEFL